MQLGSYDCLMVGTRYKVDIKQSEQSTHFSLVCERLSLQLWTSDMSLQAWLVVLSVHYTIIREPLLKRPKIGPSTM